MPLSNHTHRRRRAKQLETASRADDAFAAQVAALQVYAERYEQIIQSENFAIELQRTEDLRAQRDMLRLVQASARPSVPKRARVLLLTLPCVDSCLRRGAGLAPLLPRAALSQPRLAAAVP